MLAALCGLLALVGLTYTDHFHNAFHFDDSHAVVENPYIRDLHNIPRFFTDGATSSALPANRVYRPVVMTSLAVDYWLGRGLQPLWFHISTFFWFLVQLGLMFLLFRSILDRSRPAGAGGGSFANAWVALFAVALYGVHPVMAETVNYIIQRSDLYAALAVIAGLVMYIELPGLRRFGLYLLPVVAGILSKATAAVFPALLFAWIWLFDDSGVKRALRRTMPALLVTGAVSWFTIRMTPPTYVTGAFSAYAYRITQPAVLLGYFLKFFVPLGLSADTDRVAKSSFLQEDIVYGFVFILAATGIALWCTKRRELRPIGFGLAWFLITSLPTSVIALAEVENDHRMYLPFVGLTLSVCWAAALLIERRGIAAKVFLPVCALVLIAFALGTWERNQVWRTDESLWRDVTIKSPNNGRGLMNYGLTLMEKGRYPEALAYFDRALAHNPNYYILEINLAIANGAMGKSNDAERHFQRAIQLAPADASAQYFYARWLAGAQRAAEAIEHLKIAIRENPDYVYARYLLMQLDAAAGDASGLRQEAQETLARFPEDATAKSWLARAAQIHTPPPSASSSPGSTTLSADQYLNLSLSLYKAGKYVDCIAAARQALKIRPNYAEAWNNIGAAYNAMSRWDQGIAAEQHAIRLKPGFQLAKNNLAWAEIQKQRSLGVAGK